MSYQLSEKQAVNMQITCHRTYNSCHYL